MEKSIENSIDKSIDKSIETMYCSVCGSTNVQVRAWVNANTSEFVGYAVEDIEDCWCEDCQEHTELKTLRELFEDFIESNSWQDDYLTNDFMCFPAGTETIAVWEWFDAKCPNGVAEDLVKKYGL